MAVGGDGVLSFASDVGENALAPLDAVSGLGEAKVELDVLGLGGEPRLEASGLPEGIELLEEFNRRDGDGETEELRVWNDVALGLLTWDCEFVALELSFVFLFVSVLLPVAFFDRKGLCAIGGPLGMALACCLSVRRASLRRRL